MIFSLLRPCHCLPFPDSTVLDFLPGSLAAAARRTLLFSASPILFLTIPFIGFSIGRITCLYFLLFESQHFILRHGLGPPSPPSPPPLSSWASNASGYWAVFVSRVSPIKKQIFYGIMKKLIPLLRRELYRFASPVPLLGARSCLRISSARAIPLLLQKQSFGFPPMTPMAVSRPGAMERFDPRFPLLSFCSLLLTLLGFRRRTRFFPDFLY